MARLSVPFGFPLGGDGLTGGKPWIVNFSPRPDAEKVGLLRPVRMSFRDAESYIDPAQMLVEIGYAKVHANGNAIDSFDKLPRTKRGSLHQGFLASTPTISLTSDGIVIEKTVNGAQRSIYTTAVDAGTGYQSALVSAVVKPLVVASQGATANSGPLNQSVYPGPLLPIPFSSLEAAFASGAVMGLEHGPRGKVVYLFFNTLSASHYLQMTSYQPLVGDPAIKLTRAYDWSAGFSRYTIVWNEALGYVEVYADFNGMTDRIFRVPISSVPDMPDKYYCRYSSLKDVVALYGQEGSSGDRSCWKNVAVTTDVGYPILGNIRPGTFATKVLGSEFLRTFGSEDPRELDVGCWLPAEEGLFPNLDPAFSASSSNGLFIMNKPTHHKSFALYREEPGLLRSANDGFMVQVKMNARPIKQDSAATGMGFVVYDGRSVFQVMLFNDFATKTVGLLKKFGSDADVSQYLVAGVKPINWAKDGFRLVVDPRSNTMKFYAMSDLTIPAMSVEFDRDLLPTGADKNWDGLAPFVAFGHVSSTTDSFGALDVSEITICHLYQEWEARDGLPSEGGVDPVFTLDTQGGVTQEIADGLYSITTTPDATVKLHRQVPFSANRGGVVEARVRVPSFRPRSRTGVYLILDDGNTAYSLTFVETSTGRFVAMSLRAGLFGFQEIVGKDGQGAALSFPCDWTQFHTYRIERRPYAGIHVFLDNESVPRIVYPEAKISQLPDEQFDEVPSIGFGHFTGDVATSEWQFVRGFFSGGYEISFKKNKSDKVLRQELFGTQAIVIAYAEDRD